MRLHVTYECYQKMNKYIQIKHNLKPNDHQNKPTQN